MKNTGLKRFIQNTQFYSRKTLLKRFTLNIKLTRNLNKNVIQ